MKKTFILRSRQIRDNCLGFIRDLSLDTAMQVEIKPYKKNRTLAQNRLLWLWNTEIADHIYESTGERYSPEEVHEWMKAHFLPVRTISIDNEAVLIRRSTRDMNTKELTEYLEQIDFYAGANLGLQLTHPADLYWEAMRGQ